MITVKSKVKSQKILKVLVLLSALSKHSSKVVRPILLKIDLSWQSTTTTVSILVDLGSNGRKLSKQRNTIVKGRLPVISLVKALLISLGELGLVVERRNSHGELRHGMKILGEVIEHL
jgi:hypothetical protein